MKRDLRMDGDDIKRRLQVVSREDRRRAVFGAGSHNYELNPPLDVAEIEALNIGCRC